MAFVELSEKDVLRGTIIDTAWYLVRIDTIGEGQPSKDKESINYLVEGTIMKNTDTGDEKFVGFPTPYWNFNSKALGFLVGFLKAMGVEPKAGRINLDGAKGKTLRVFIEQDEYNGNIVNRINHKYAPAEKAE